MSERGIEANPEKIDAIKQMKPPMNVREVQKLMGRIAALSRFLSKWPKEICHFSKPFRGPRKFSWTPECQKSFDELKQYLQSLPALVSPAADSELLLYLVVSPVAVSAALVQETEVGQKPVCSVSEALQGAKTSILGNGKAGLRLGDGFKKVKALFPSPQDYSAFAVPHWRSTKGQRNHWAPEQMGIF